MSKNLLFNSKDELITITIHYRIKKNKYGNQKITIVEENEIQSFMEKGEEINSLETKWKPQTWVINNSILKNSMNYNKVTGQSEVDFGSYQQNVFKYCLEAWDMTDDAGNPIPPTIENVGLLPAHIGKYLFLKYENSLQMDEEEKKE